MSIKTPSQQERQKASMLAEIEWSCSHYPMTERVNTRKFAREIVDPVEATFGLLLAQFGQDALYAFDDGRPESQRVRGLLEARWRVVMAQRDKVKSSRSRDAKAGWDN